MTTKDSVMRFFGIRTKAFVKMCAAQMGSSNSMVATGSKNYQDQEPSVAPACCAAEPRCVHVKLPAGAGEAYQLVHSSLMTSLVPAQAKSRMSVQKPLAKTQAAATIPDDRIVVNYGPWRSLSEFTNFEEIGCGRLSVVWSAKCKDTGLTFAIKKYRRSLITAQAATADALKRNVQREVAMLKSLRGIPSICHLYGTFEDAEGAYLVQEYCPGGDLLDVLRELGGKVPEDVLVPLVLAPLLKCLAHVHEKGVMHRDLKPENIFVDAAGHPRLGDFGLAINFLEEAAVDRVGTLDYMAPEVLLNKAAARSSHQGAPVELPSKYSSKVDTWAVGILAYEMLTGAPPFEVASEVNTAALILWTDVPVNGVWPSHLSFEAISFIKWALRKVPDSRPSATDMLYHPWLTKYCPELAAEAAKSPKSGRVRPRASVGATPGEPVVTWTRNPTVAGFVTPVPAREEETAPDEIPPAASIQHGKSASSVIQIPAGSPTASAQGAAASVPTPVGFTLVPTRHSTSDVRAHQQAGGARPSAALTGGMPTLVRSMASMVINNRASGGAAEQGLGRPSGNELAASNNWSISGRDDCENDGVTGDRAGKESKVVGGSKAKGQDVMVPFGAGDSQSSESGGSDDDGDDDDDNDEVLFGAHGAVFQFDNGQTRAAHFQVAEDEMVAVERVTPRSNKAGVNAPESRSFPAASAMKSRQAGMETTPASTQEAGAGSSGRAVSVSITGREGDGKVAAQASASARSRSPFGVGPREVDKNRSPRAEDASGMLAGRNPQASFNELSAQEVSYSMRPPAPEAARASVKPYDPFLQVKFQGKGMQGSNGSNGRCCVLPALVKA